MSSPRLSLAELPRAIRDATGASTTYLRCYHAAVSGRIPAQRSASGRWTVARKDLPMIADTLKAMANEIAARAERPRKLSRHDFAPTPAAVSPGAAQIIITRSR